MIMGGAEFFGCSSVALRFKRWRRGGYAAFVSVVHVVSIGALSVSISKSLGVKSDGLMTVVSNWLRGCDDDSADGTDMDLAVVKELEMCNVGVAAVSVGLAADAALNRYIKNIKYRFTGGIQNLEGF